MDLIKPSIKKTNNIIEILLDINQKCYLYFKNRNIQNLESFIDGYTYAQYVNGFKIDDLDIYNDFFEWIKIKYNYIGMEGFFDLFNKIFNSHSLEEKFEIFCNLLLEFLATR